MSIEEEVQRLMEWLSEEDLATPLVQAELERAGPAVRGALVRRAAESPLPLPAPVVGWLALLESEETAPELARVYLTSLASPDPRARRGGLYGLDRLNHAAAAERAAEALADADGSVVTAAADIALRHGADAPGVRARMAEVQRTRRGDPRFAVAVAMIDAHGTGAGPLPGDVA